MWIGVAPAVEEAFPPFEVRVPCGLEEISAGETQLLHAGVSADMHARPHADATAGHTAGEEGQASQAGEGGQMGDGAQTGGESIPDESDTATAMRSASNATAPAGLTDGPSKTARSTGSTRAGSNTTISTGRSTRVP